MAETGPMGKLRGDSPWKDFVITWGMIALGITAILAIAAGIATANLIYLKSKQAQKIELRRMQALDIG